MSSTSNGPVPPAVDESPAESSELSDSEILAALDQTGFLLEQRVAQVFKRNDPNNDFDVEVNVPYKDPTEGKSREIDVRVDYGNTAGDWNMAAPYVSAKFFIECKNTLNPFVLTGGNQNKNGIGTNYVSEFDPLEFGWAKKIYSTAGYLQFGKMPGGPYADGFCASQLVRLDRQHGKWRASNTGVFDSIVYPLAKVERVHRPKKFSDFKNEGASPTFYFSFPLVVTRGPVYSARVNGDETRIRRVRWCACERTFDGDELNGGFTFEVVEYAHLVEYINERAMKFVHSVENELIKNASLYNPMWLEKNYGEPSYGGPAFAQWREAFKEETGLS